MYWEEKQAKKQSNEKQYDVGHSSFMYLKRTKNWVHNVKTYLIQKLTLYLLFKKLIFPNCSSK